MIKKKEIKRPNEFNVNQKKSSCCLFVWNQEIQNEMAILESGIRNWNLELGSLNNNINYLPVYDATATDPRCYTRTLSKSILNHAHFFYCLEKIGGDSLPFT